MVYHKALTPADGERGIKMNKKRLVLTKVVLDEPNTAAALCVKVDGAWAPFEFLDSEKKRTVDINIAVEPGETVYFMCRDEPYWGKEYTVNGALAGGRVKLHLYGNFCQVDSVDPAEPEVKRVRLTQDRRAAVEVDYRPQACSPKSF